MNFRISDTFTNSLLKLNRDEQKAVKTTAFDLQMNPANPGMKFHRIDRAKDKNFWSVRVSRDIRLIVHKSESSLLLCYAGHHDDAYHWAERRKLETHPKTGAAQLVEVREMVKEITLPLYTTQEPTIQEKQPLLNNVTEDELLSLGVPPEWVEDVRMADEDTLLELVDHLPGEAAESLLELATGGTPQVKTPSVETKDPFTHPDTQRRFRVIENVEELERALEYPWEKWIIFLHPAQRETVERNYNGPARISGSAGTGKTIVALHRAVYLARNNSDARVLLTTFSEILANSLRTKLRRLISNEPRIAERVEVHSINSIGKRLFELNIDKLNLAFDEDIGQLLETILENVDVGKFNRRFILNEWKEVVDAWQLDTWEAYRDVRRLGRKTRIPEKQREIVWQVFERIQSGLNERGLITIHGMFNQLASHFKSTGRVPYDFAVVDEAQDISVPQLRFLSALFGEKTNGLFFTGDLGQRIFQQPFSWKALGVEIQGRSSILRINYRTSHQIRNQADRLLSTEISDVDGNIEDRRSTISVFNGPAPSIKIFQSNDEEINFVSDWLNKRKSEGIVPKEIGIFVRSVNEFDRAESALKKAEYDYKILDKNPDSLGDHVALSTMHLAKGLEFRAVVVMACDDEIIPLQERIESVADDSDLEEVYNTERHLLYVACTRARDHLLVTAVEPASEFLEDLRD